ncbi:homeobox protein aristaless-like 3 isoform X1 [Lates japonicus]|uniref:Homeobox protein aristaless-like 3 isoform X1 n=1 Tax=Lates japonicus TaxID=270547 RepID=A0AAD3MYA5_LATJO|nr:homeobox protein aristaless-like 3 isoform X1 [Lates japonicus]
METESCLTFSQTSRGRQKTPRLSTAGSGGPFSLAMSCRNPRTFLLLHLLLLLLSSPLSLRGDLQRRRHGEVGDAGGLTHGAASANLPAPPSKHSKP